MVAVVVGDKMLKTIDVQAKTTLCRAKLYAMVNTGEFPQPVKLGKNNTWRESTIDEWIANHFAVLDDTDADADADAKWRRDAVDRDAYSVGRYTPEVVIRAMDIRPQEFAKMRKKSAIAPTTNGASGPLYSANGVAIALTLTPEQAEARLKAATDDPGE